VEEDALPDEIEATGHSDTGVLMALRHRSLPIEGVQFHPESVLTEGGHRMVANWLRCCGAKIDQARVDQLCREVELLRGAAFAGA
jgi:para-aminobenzoate synthetase component 2